VVGPEGGWSQGEVDGIISRIEEEQQLHHRHHISCFRVSLGEGILRAETASLYALSALNAYSSRKRVCA
jgi:16S rRNA U1498 N3-methylase RsmE